MKNKKQFGRFFQSLMSFNALICAFLPVSNERESKICQGKNKNCFPNFQNDELTLN